MSRSSRDRDDPVAQLVWLSASEAQVWVPTLAELDKLHAQRQARLNPTPKRKTRSDSDPSGQDHDDDQFHHANHQHWPQHTSKNSEQPT